MSNSGTQMRLFPSDFALKALRHGPYRNSAKALAEIVDNSYDADAKNIHVALVCKADGRPHTIAVLDNGKGMDEHTLARCIQYGYNSENSVSSRRSIGKFGVGLLSASFNQCQNLEVFSWTNGLDRAQVNSTNIQVEGCGDYLPQVTTKPLPDFFDYGFPSFDHELTNLNKHGTLVVWRDLDKVSWKKADTFCRHLKNEVGRIYRNFLHSDSLESLEIRINIVNDEKKATVEEIPVGPIDPLFLSHWKCDELEQYIADLKLVQKDPQKYGVDIDTANLALKEKHLFKAYNFENKVDNATNEDGTPVRFDYGVKDEAGDVIGEFRIMASYRRPRIVRAASFAGHGSLRNPGHAKYGNLAEKLQGVSILRDGRELSLDANWLRADRTVDRWVALSIDFDSSLDEYFGVSNDKQLAKSLAELAQIKITENTKEDYNHVVIEVAGRIHKILNEMRSRISKYDSPKDLKFEHSKHSDPASEKLQIQILNSRKLKQGFDKIKGVDDVPIDIEKLTEALTGSEIENTDATVSRPKIIKDNDLNYDIVSSSCFGNSDMFDAINNASGAMVIRLNAEHPLYLVLKDIIRTSDDDDDEPEQPDDNDQDVKDKLSKAMTTIRQLTVAYFRTELLLSEKSDEIREVCEEFRRIWSKTVRKLTEE